MAAYKSSPPNQSANKRVNGKGYEIMSHKDRDLAGMSPDMAQEAVKPTESEPMPMHKRMAGCS